MAAWDSRLAAFVTLTDYDGRMSGSDWLRAVGQVQASLALLAASPGSWLGDPGYADRRRGFSFGYGSAERLEQIKALLRRDQDRFPGVAITIMTGEIRALVGTGDASMTAS